MYNMAMKTQDISGTDYCIPRVNRKVLSNIRKLVSIVQKFGIKLEKMFLFWNFEWDNVDIVKYSNWVISVP